ncbi:hypothetical protein FB385_3132 [Paramicrobacterium agarici]|nr:hypothetical protein FB385_3132 [Microbacterium agarici]
MKEKITTAITFFILGCALAAGWTWAIVQAGGAS